jgi:hypothetical protein
MHPRTSRNDRDRGGTAIKTGTELWTYDTGVDHADRTVRVAMTKEQIKEAPDAEDLRDEGYFDRHATYYGRYA